MKIYARAEGWVDEKGRTYTTEQVKELYDRQNAKDGRSLFEKAVEKFSPFPLGTTTYDQTGAIENAVQGNGRGVDVSNVQNMHKANSYWETDSDKAARLREASNILGFDEGKENLLMQTGMDNNDIMKSALALAKKKQSEPDDWEQFAADHPATVKYLEQQKNMAISYDDVKPLGRLEETANQVKTHLEMMELEEKIADLGRKYDSANISYNELSADQRVELNDLLTRRKELQGNIDPWSVGNVLGGLLAMKEDLPMALAIGLQTGIVGAGAGALAGGVGAVPGAITGFGAGFRIGMGMSMGYRMAGTQYAENMMRADANGQYMDANSLRQGAWAAGLGMGVLGSVGVGRLTNKLPMGQVYDKFLRTTSPSVLNNPEAREAAWKGYLSTLGVGLKEAAIQDVIFGGGGAALTYGSNRYSEALSGLDYSNREDGTLAENILNGMQQFAPMALGTGVGFSVGGRMMSNALGKKGNTAPMPVADGLNKTMDALNETKTAQRSPQASREMVNTVFGENASAQDVEINARGIVRLCQEADPENPNLAAEVAQKLGVDEKTFSEAVETGDNIRVSVTDFVQEMKDSELRPEMLKEVKDIDGVTENERGEILTHQQQVFEQNMEFIKKAAKAEYDHNDPAWVAAYEATQKAYPKLKPKDLEQLTNITYAGFKQMEERGVLQLNGFENAEQAIRAIDVRRVDAPREQAEMRADERAASDVANDTVQELFQSAWHGTPHDFDKFDLGAIGTGEGQQVHGWGLYFAQDRSISENRYKERLSKGNRVLVRGKEISEDDFYDLPIAERIAYEALEDNKQYSMSLDDIIEVLENDSAGMEMYPEEAIAEAVNLLRKGEVAYGDSKGKLFEVEIPDNDVLLDEQKPLSQQPEKVKKAIIAYYKTRPDYYGEIDDNVQLPQTAGKYFYKDVIYQLQREGVSQSEAPKEASLLLNELGIKGITYEGGRDGRCFVVFDDKAVEVINKYNQEQGKQGNVLASYMPQDQGHAIIELYKNANPSSLAHEMLHHWVFLHENAYRTGKMEGQVLQDFQKLAEFAGHELGTEWSREEHEKLASAWETYLSEGKAPSLELVSTFERFKNWMKRIYQTLTRHAIPINDDVRGVFDRMLAGDRELEMAQAFYESEPLFAGREMGAAELREYAALVNAAHNEAQKEMDKRVRAEVNPAMKEIRDNVAANMREDIAGQMMLEPVYAARALFTAPLESADLQAAKATALKVKREKRLDLLVRQSALGVEKPGMIAENAKHVSSEWFSGFSNNYDWYKQMFRDRGGKIPASWYRFIKAYKAGEKTLKQMPKTMREEYERIAEEQLTHGHKESVLGDIPEDIEFVNLKEGTPAMSWIVQNGGGIRLDRQSVYDRYGKGALNERWLTDKGGYTLDEVAEYVYEGKAGGDRLYEELTTKPTFAKELSNRVRVGMAQFKEQEYGSLRESAIKAVHNAKSLEALGVEMEILASKQEEFKGKQQQKTADAIAEGREKSKQQEKIEAERQKGKEAVQKQKEKDTERLDRETDKAREKGRVEGAREQHKLDVAVSRGKLRAKAAREMAKAQLESTKVGEVLKWQKYAALGKKAGDEAVRLLAKGDYEGALEAKDRQIMCHALALEAGKMDTEINRTMKYFDRINKRGNKMKGIPHEFNVQIDKILSNYGLLSREPLKPLEGDKSLQTFIAECQEDYFTPQVADYLINGQPQHYSWLTVGELRDLKSSVESLHHVGKQMDALVANEKKQRISDIAASMVEQLSTHEKKYALEGEMGAYDKTPLSVTSLVKAETLLRLMDKGEENGVFVQNIYNPIKLGLDDMANRSRKIIADVDKLLADTGWTKAELAKLKDQEHTFDFMPNPKITHEQVLHAALNWGNEGNRDRLRYYFLSPAERKKATWTEQELAEVDARVMQMFEVLTEKDLKLVQGVWDYLETYAPEIRKHEIDCAGVDPKMVEPTAFSVMTSDGKVVNLKGGYYPIRYDSGKSVRAMDLKEANELFKNNSAVNASVEHGHTKNRVNHMNRPLLLDWSTFTDHLRNVNYDLAMRKPIMDVSRLLRRDDVQSAIAETFGNDNLRMLQTWVRDVATDQREALTFTEKAMRWTRTRMSVAFLGFRIKALFIDLPQNFITATWQNGADSVIKGVSQFYLTGDYREKIAFVNQRSPMMRDKASFMDANLADLRTDLMDGSMSAKLTRIAQKTAFCCDMFSDSAVNYPTWIRYWEEATARGLDDAAASLEADAKVRRQSVDTSKAGMAAVQRGGEGRKLLTPFYSYFSAYFNRLYYDFNLAQIKWADGQQMDAAGLMVRTAVLGVGIPTTIEAIMQGVVLNNDREKDKKKREENMYREMASSSFSYLANTIPVAGAVASFSFNKAIGKKYANYELSPVEGAIEGLFSVPAAVVNYVGAEKTDKDAGRKLAEAVAKAAAIGVPYPNMLNTLALNIWDVMTQSGDFTLSDIVTRRRNQK